MPGLRLLALKDTKTTEPRVKALAAKLPQCPITWDGGVIEPEEAMTSLVANLRQM